jgi:Transposase DDE domain
MHLPTHAMVYQGIPPHVIIKRSEEPLNRVNFILDWDAGTILCPNQVGIPFHPGVTVHFSKDQRQICPLDERCTTSASGRSVHIHPDERLLQELRERQLTPQGRTKLRERVPGEHALAHIGRWQGRRARYGGSLFDLRRCAVVHNLHAMQHLPPTHASTCIRGGPGRWQCLN